MLMKFFNVLSKSGILGLLKITHFTFQSKIGVVGMFKTIYFNFRYLPFKQAVFMPVVLSSRVSIRNMGRNRLVLDSRGGELLVSCK